MRLQFFSKTAKKKPGKSKEENATTKLTFSPELTHLRSLAMQTNINFTQQQTILARMHELCGHAFTVEVFDAKEDCRRRFCAVCFLEEARARKGKKSIFELLVKPPIHTALSTSEYQALKQQARSLPLMESLRSIFYRYFHV